jgi:hypothetical protein
LLSEKAAGNSFLVENWPQLLNIFQDLEESQIAEYEVISQPFMSKGQFVDRDLVVQLKFTNIGMKPIPVHSIVQFKGNRHTNTLIVKTRRLIQVSPPSNVN